MVGYAYHVWLNTYGEKGVAGGEIIGLKFVIATNTEHSDSRPLSPEFCVDT